MNPLLHQLRNDFRHQRPWLIAFWATLPLQVFVAALATPYYELRTTLEIGLLLLQVLAAAIVIVRAVHADAFVGDTVFWKTRPLTPQTLLAAKSLLVLLGLVLPFTLAAMLGWTNAGVSVTRLPAGVMSVWLVVLPGVAIALTLAGLSRNLGQLVAGCGALFMVFVVTMLVVSRLGEAGFLPQRNYNVDLGTVAAGIDTSSAVLALAWLAVLGFTAWVLAASRRFKVSAALLALAVVGAVTLRITWSYPVFGRVSLPETRVPVEAIPADDATPAGPGGQVLWSTFRIPNLPTDQVAVATHLAASFQPESGPALRFLHSTPWGAQAGAFDLQHSPQEADYLRTVQAAFPPDTLWFGDWGVFTPRTLPLDTGGREVLIRNDWRGRFEGHLSLRFLHVRHLADVPLKPATVPLDGEMSLTVRRVNADAGGIVIALEERRTNFLLDREHELAIARPWRSARFVYVLHQPSTGEAVVRDPESHGWGRLALYGGQTIRNDQLRFEFPRLQQHLAGLPMAEWMEGARLHVFDARPVGWTQETFDIADFKLRMDGSPQGELDRQASLARLNELNMAEDASDEQARAYVREVEELAMELRQGYDWRLFREKLLALGTNHVDALIQSWPINDHIRSSAGNHVLGQLAARDNLPDLLEALRRDPGLVWLFQQKKWEDDARPVLREMLSEFGVPLPAGAVAVAARGASPQLFPLLARRFVLLENGHEVVAPVLEELPGFDLESAVRAAWKRALVGLADRAGLAIAAARFGLPQSLDAAIEAVDQGRRSYQDDFWSRQLREVTGYEPSPDEKPEAFRDWLLANWSRFTYDADLHGYRVE